VSVAAAVLLALPVSLGFVVARTGSHLQSPLAAGRPVVMQRAFVGGILAGKVIASQTAMSAGSAGQTITDLSSHIQVKPHKHKHKHGGGD
jgi:hypothetical protein